MAWTAISRTEQNKLLGKYIICPYKKEFTHEPHTEINMKAEWSELARPNKH
jgi:hypothetical protein